MTLIVHSFSGSYVRSNAVTIHISSSCAFRLTKYQFTFSRFARVGDNYILSPDPDEQTFRVSKIIKHGEFKPLGASNGGDGRHDIALVGANFTFS